MGRYLSVFNDSFPYEDLKPCKYSFKNAWYNQGLKELNDLKERNYRKYIKNKTNEYLKDQYYRSKNEYMNKIKWTKKNFFHSIFLKVKNDVKKTWRVINSVLGRKKEKQLFKLRIDGKDINDDLEIANEFNNYFSNVANNLVNKIPTSSSRRKYWEYLRNRNKNNLKFNATNPSEVLKLINNFSSKMSSGWDDIPQKIVKKSPINIIIVLTHIFNLSMSEGVFPSSMKKAKVIPIHKKGSKLDV